jgi:hypothetical protein
MIRALFAFLLTAGVFCLAQAQVPQTGAGKGAPGGGGGVGLTAWVMAVMTAGGAVSGTQQTRVGNLITSLQSASLYSIWDAIWLLDSENPTQASIDIVNLKTWTASGTVAQGATGYSSSTAGYLITTVNISTTTNYTQNSATLMGYVTVAPSTAGIMMGASNGAIWGMVQHDTGGTRAGSGINILNGDFNVVAGTHNTGLIFGVRNGGGTTNDVTTVYDAADTSGISGGSSGDAAGTRPNQPVFLLSENASGAPAASWNGTLAAAGIGASLTGAQMTTFCQSLNNGYLAARGHSLFTC